MSMLKTGKKKVVAGVVAVGVLTGGGAVFGATDGGTHLKNWFEGIFQEKKAGVEVEYNEYWDGEIAELDTLVGKQKTDAKLKLEAKKRTEMATKGKNITKEAAKHVSAIGVETKELEKYMNTEFEKLKTKVSDEIHVAGTEWFRGAHTDLEEITNELGEEARDTVQKGLDTATEMAIGDIQKAIDKAKAELTAQLATKSDATAKDIKDMIDERIFGVTYQITAAANYMVQEQEKLIADLAAELEDAAMQKMNDLVNGH